MVSGSQSFTVGGGGVERPAPLFAYTEAFEKHFPTYLAIGMTYEQYWEGSADLVRAYRRAFELQQEFQNQQAWLQGLYIYEALVDVSPALRSMGAKKPKPYSKKPYELNVRKDAESKKITEKKSQEKAKAYMEAFAMATNKRFAKKDGDVNG